MIISHVTIADGRAEKQSRLSENTVLTFNTLTELYRAIGADYPKFFKMCPLSKTAFLGAELLLEGLSADDKAENLDIILFTADGCAQADMAFYKSILNETEYFPSPAQFVYTLPNIMTGEIAIRHKIYGETTVMYADEELRQRVTESHIRTFPDRLLMAGIVDFAPGGQPRADIILYKSDNQITTKPQNMEQLIEQLKQQIIETLNLEDLTSADIDAEAPLFGEGLGLDSIDALELIVLLERNYGIKLTNPAEGKNIFKSVKSIAEYVSANRKK